MTKHKEQSIETQEKLSQSLKKLMTKKALSKITISDIVTYCGVNRNTFYYHFEDIYDLLKWTFEQEALLYIEEINTLDNFETITDFAIKYIKENRRFCQCAYETSPGAMQLKVFFYKFFFNIITNLANEIITKNSYRVSKEFTSYIVENYCELMAGFLMKLIYTTNDEEIQRYRRYFMTLFNTSLQSTLQSGHEQKL